MNNFNSATELAKERNRAADSIITILNQSLGDTLNTWRASRILGLGFVALGIFSMLYAAIDHRRQIRNLERNELRYVSRLSSTLVVAYILAGLGGIAFVTMAVSNF